MPGVAAFVLFGGYYLQAMKRREVSKFMLFLLLIVVFYAVYGLGMSVKFIQASMGFYIWSYFLLGVLVAVYGKEDKLFKLMPVIWVISVFEVILNYFWEYPWIGENIVVAGTTMQAAVSWAAEGGIERLPGFSRASYAVAAHILLCCSYMMISKRYPAFLKPIVFGLSCLAIFLTTSKTELGLLVALPFPLFTYWGLKRLWPEGRAAFHYARLVVAFMVCLVVFMPLTLSTHQQTTKSTGALFGFITGDTVIQRMTQMWPRSVRYSREKRKPCLWPWHRRDRHRVGDA